MSVQTSSIRLLPARPLPTTAPVADLLIALLGVSAMVADIFLIGGIERWNFVDPWVALGIILAPATLAFRLSRPLIPCVTLTVAITLAYLPTNTQPVLLVCLAVALFPAARSQQSPIRWAAPVIVFLPLVVTTTIWPKVIDLVYCRPDTPTWLFPNYARIAASDYTEHDTIQHWPVALSLVLAAIWLAGYLLRSVDLRSQLAPLLDDVVRVEDRGSPWRFDGLLAVSFALLELWDHSQIEADDRVGISGALTVFLLLAPLSLVLRRRLPVVPCAALGVAATAGYATGQTPWVLIVALAVALYSTAAWRRPAYSAAVAGGVLAAMYLASKGLGSHELVGIVYSNQQEAAVWLFHQDLGTGLRLLETAFDRVWPLSYSVALVAPWCLGLLVRTVRRSQQTSVREEQLLKRNQEHEQTQVLLEERAQIARDLHDVVAHHVNLMVIQAEAHKTEESVQGFQRIGDTGRRALTELDRMLWALRGEPGSPVQAPMPGLGQLPALAESLTEQGIPVELEVRGDPAALADSVQLTVYRLAQEALTNVAKHSRAEKARLLVDVRARGVSVEIRDDGSGFDVAAASTGYRHGLAGMNERVRIHHGTLEIMASPGDGTTIKAWLPLVPGVAGPDEAVDTEARDADGHQGEQH
ncbi:sensor histidine kinase [Kribbella sp. NPDC051620]|uniref:sensor histidine kinase n=1 Tax=Kribbella sp. NPDC051620 TaxID=3364120 RepID=UPI0037B5FEC5